MRRILSRLLQSRHFRALAQQFAKRRSRHFFRNALFETLDRRDLMAVVPGLSNGGGLSTFDDELHSTKMQIGALLPPSYVLSSNSNPEGESAGSPVAFDLTFDATEDTLLVIDASMGLLLYADSPNETPLTATLYTQSSLGIVTLLEDGSFSYAPNENANGTDTFQYFVNDGESDSNIATVTINIEAILDTPVPQDDYYSILPNSSLIVPAPGVLLNDLNPDNRTLVALGTTARTEHGIVGISSNGRLTYIATVNIDIWPTYDEAIPVSNAFTLLRDSQLTIDAAQLLENDENFDGRFLRVHFEPSGLTANGELTNNMDGTFTYTPDTGFIGQDSFTYRLVDEFENIGALSANVVFNVIGYVTANDDEYYAVEDTPLVVTASLGVLANDSSVFNRAITASMTMADKIHL